MDVNQLGRMLEQLGPEWIEIAAIDRLDPDTWLLAFDDGVEFSIELDSSEGLVLSSPLGRPPVDRRFVVYESLLSFNSLWRDFGGHRLGLNGPDADVLLIRTLDAQLGSASDLRELLTEFAGLARQWKNYVEAQATALTLAAPLPMLGILV